MAPLNAKGKITMVAKKPLEEQEIRDELIRFLNENNCDGERIQEEFRIERGGSLIDVAIIGKRLIGYEIKSDKDSFSRFSGQIHAYNRVFDQINLVCGPNLAPLVHGIIPSWWGVLLAKRKCGKVCLEVVRKARKNPKQDPFSLASLLWKDEAMAVLVSENVDIPKRPSSNTLWGCMATELSIKKIKTIVIDVLLDRL